MHEFDSPGDEIEDEEYPDEPSDEDDSSDTLECPSCGEEVYEDAEQCPHCGQFITLETGVLFGRPWWWVALGLLGVVSLIAALLLY
jgi:hypothetical protein